MVYYAHSKLIYGTKREKRELAFLKKKFTFVIDPNKDMGELGSIDPYLKKVDECDMVVCSPHDGYLGRGQYSEVLHALKLNKPVYSIQKSLLFGFQLKKVTSVSTFDTNDWSRKYSYLVY
jgi:hypothetical protein